MRAQCRAYQTEISHCREHSGCDLQNDILNDILYDILSKFPRELRDTFRRPGVPTENHKYISIHPPTLSTGTINPSRQLFLTGHYRRYRQLFPNATMSPTTHPPPREWHEQIDQTPYLISTNQSLLDHAFINASFASNDMYWAKPLPSRDLDLMLSNSLTLGLYEQQQQAPPSQTTPPPHRQIGLARFATDHVTFAFLTDVYISPAHRASGLGAWLIACCGEVMDGMPALRRALLMASEGAGAAYYEKALGMRDVGGEGHGLVCMSRKGPGSALGE